MPLPKQSISSYHFYLAHPQTFGFKELLFGRIVEDHIFVLACINEVSYHTLESALSLSCNCICTLYIHLFLKRRAFLKWVK